MSPAALGPRPAGARRPAGTRSAGSLAAAVRDTARRLDAAGLENSWREACELVAAAAGCSAQEVQGPGTSALAGPGQRRLARLLARRLRREPLAYLLGEWDFAGIRFSLTRDVLIPRPETEELLELILKDRGLREFEREGAWPVWPWWASDKAPVPTLGAARGQDLSTQGPGPALHIADVGTGSGCLAVALARFLPQAQVWATDISEQALRVARKNAAAHGLRDRVRFFRGDLLGPLRRVAPPLDLVAANLPYIRRKDLARLQPEVRWEPRTALDGGPDGLAVIRRVISQAWSALKPGGKLVLEVGHDQAERVAALLAASGFSGLRTEKDFAGIPRFVCGSR
jgi:release factor glutamine methyltransferase